MVDVQLIVDQDADLIVFHADLHFLCIDSDEHLPVRGLIIGQVLFVFFKDHV